MNTREDSLRKILEAAGGRPFRRLVDDQKLELVNHVEDAVDAKMIGGMNELEAVAESLEELGNLKKIARQFSRVRVVETVAPRIRLQAPDYFTCMTLVLFMFFQLIILPIFQTAAHLAPVKVPPFSQFFFNMGFVGVAGVLGVFGFVYWLRARRKRTAVWAWATAGGAFLVCVASIAAAVVPTF